MEPGPPETKRPRLSTGSSWSNHGVSVSLPHPAVAHHPSASGPHISAPPPYQPPPPFSRPAEPPLPSAHHHPHDDRRHHDHDPYPPIQDPPRQLPPSPAHPPYPTYGPRDPVVKRDPGEETSLPQLRRPNSTGHVTDGLPPTPHGPPHPGHQHLDDSRRHMSFDNGPPMPHSPALYRPPPNYHPPPTPVGQHPQYESSHVYGHPAPMYPAALEIQAASAKRKAQRASQACDSCRQLKAKCDETKPCKNCREKNIDCKYRDPPAKQPDKVTADILELLSSMKEEMTNGFAAMRKMDHRLTSVEASLRQMNPATTNMKVESIEQDDPPNFRSSPVPTKAPDETSSSPGGTVIVEPSLTVDEAQATLREVDDDLMEDQPGPPVKPGKPAMPINHTTLAGLLLTWPSIKEMVQHLLEAEKIHYVEEFPIRQEQQRGMLRVFGKGEGFDQDIRPSDKETPQDQTMTDIIDEYSDVASPSPHAEVWGQVGMTPPPGIEHKGGVLNVDGNPDWDPNKVWKYVQSFKDNILNMHPIIIPKELDAMVKLFIESFPKGKDVQGTKPGTAKFVNQPTTAIPSLAETGTKRKRSPAMDEQSSPNPFYRPGRPFRSVHSALVLLVLALGKICLHKDKIPDVVQDSDIQTNSSLSVRNGILASPLQGSPPGILSQPHSSGLPSPKENERLLNSRRASFQGPGSITKGTHTHKRNLDVIPGLEYFALATDIIGSHVGGFNLKHVYVHILAGLYHGQLGRVLESWSYISLASRTLQVILRPSLGRLSTQSFGLGSSRRDNQLAFAFWTCLQLESDILAELPLPQSGILQYEDRMPYPNIGFAVNQGFEEHIVQGYLAQLYLRKQLNQVHNLLYDPEKNSKTRTMEDPAIEEGINEIQKMLKNSRNTWVPLYYRWNDDDPPANEILGARLRAKYWGSQVILYRPFLRNILEREALPPTMYRGQPPPRENWASLGLDVGSPNVPANIDPRTINYARLAIHALVESTRAFHGMDPTQRIIITNVFGTAHAQWGNLLTLAACYKDHVLGRFIDSETLSNLFAKTIAFFRLIVHPTSALMADMNILIGLAKDLGFMRDEFEIKPSSSFSSMASGCPLPPMQINENFGNMPNSATPSSMNRQLPPPPLPPHSMPQESMGR
ncbi:hypothetical protein F4809DRAFT_646143 [Biscogniauxia mediterranea]|nr:hypothetical protein F4809DRAFT_646143 [Biscogniauxia mediterranea]